MRFLIDAQLPPALARWLEQAGHEAKHVEEVGLREAEDAPIWRYALANQAVILTKDEDFAGRAKQGLSRCCLPLCANSNRATVSWRYIRHCRLTCSGTGHARVGGFGQPFADVVPPQK